MKTKIILVFSLLLSILLFTGCDNEQLNKDKQELKGKFLSLRSNDSFIVEEWNKPDLGITVEIGRNFAHETITYFVYIDSDIYLVSVNSENKIETIDKQQ